jgi:hypothetical protein
MMLRRGLFGGLALALAGCAAGPEDDGGVASLRFALSFEDHVSFQLQVFLGTPEAELAGELRFDSGCVARETTTFEVNDLPVGANYAVVYRAWGAEGCEGDPVATGFRGDVAVLDGQRAFVHLPVHAHGRGTAMPLDLNVSALSATQVGACDGSACTGELESCLDFDGSAWCVPTCEVDGDCTALHPQASCDADAGWCMLATPYPLNTSEARAFGRAVTRPDGDVVFVGGLRSGTAGLTATRFALESFDARTGLFTGLEMSGFDGRPAWGFGFAQHGDGAIVVGGLREVDALRVDGGRVVAEASWWRAGVEDAWVLGFESGKALSLPLGVRLIEPSVVPIDARRFLIAGGRIATAPTAEPGGVTVEAAPQPTRGTFICTIEASHESGVCETGPDLAVARVAPALLCVPGEAGPCDSVLAFGGAAAGEALAELVDWAGEEPGSVTVPFESSPVTSVVAPVFCGLSLVGGVSAEGAPVPGGLTLDLSRLPEGTLAWRATDGDAAGFDLPAYAAHAVDGCGLAFGGLTVAGEASQRAFSGDGPLAGRLEVTRVGAAAGRIGSGPLAGGWVVVGGAGLVEAGLRPLAGAEIWLP